MFISTAPKMAARFSNKMSRVLILTVVALFSLPVFAQNETIDNKTIAEMSRSGLSSEIILKKIASSRAAFDVSAASLIELKKAGVDDNIIAAMMERGDAGSHPLPEDVNAVGTAAPGYSESGPSPSMSSREVVANARTIAFGKSSVQPSRQALERNF
jgi:hypothetical protein